MDRRLLAVALAVVVALAGCSVGPGAGSPTPEGTDGSDAGDPGTGAEDPDATPDGAGTDGAGTDGAGTDGPSGGDAPDGTLEIHFIHVGQSAATLVVGPTGETMLVDSGDYADDGEYVLEYLQRHDVDRIDHLVTTHAHADHIGGHAALIEYYETEADGVGAVWDPGVPASTVTYEEYLDAVEEHDVTLYETRAGDEIPLAGADAAVLSPPRPYLAEEDLNENSVVLQVGFGESSVLLPGDAERAAERYLIDEDGPALDADVLLAGHHGSAGSTGPELLDAADPRIAVISSAYDSRYGHPHDETLERFAERDVRTYWTATHGDVVAVSDGEEIRIETQREAPTAPLALREGEPVAPGAPEPTEPRVTIEADGATGTAAPDRGGTRTATPAGTPVPDGGTDTAADGADGDDDADLAIVEIRADAPGDDRENLDGEYVVFEATGSDALDLTGWTVADEVGKTYEFPEGFSLDPGDRVTLYTGSGEDADSELYWGQGQPVWNNDGDTVTVRNAKGEEVVSETYGEEE